MMRLTIKRLLGVICLVLGLAALVTPLTPGAWLMFVGIELLGLSFLLPRPVRTRWEALKMRLMERWHRFRLRKHMAKDAAAAAKAAMPHAGGRGL